MIDVESKPPFDESDKVVDFIDIYFITQAHNELL